MTLAQVRDPERALALAYVPAARRPALHALWALDEMLGDIVAQAREPALAQIRLAWWRDALAGLGGGGPPPVDPLLRDLAALVAPTVGGEALATIAAGWSALLGPVDAEALTAYARERGGAVFTTAARVLGDTGFEDLVRGGRVWSLMDIALRLDPEDHAAALTLAGKALGSKRGLRWPTPLRPLGMLVALAAGDARHGQATIARGSPSRIARMIAHRVTGNAGLGEAPPSG